jgi:hypothetical protein
MRQYKHRGCESVMYTYVGEGDGPSATQRILSQDWLMPDGTKPKPGDDFARCPDCGEKFMPSIQKLIPVDQYWPARALPLPIPTKPTFWQRIKEFFTKGQS